ncbi:MAG: DUF6011 domain-containing protein [Desulfovibrionaceae bacterium]
MAHCRRCRRKLTDPASIRRGYGPECARRVQGNEQYNLLPLTAGEDEVTYGQRTDGVVAPGKKH